MYKCHLKIVHCRKKKRCSKERKIFRNEEPAWVANLKYEAAKKTGSLRRFQRYPITYKGWALQNPLQGIRISTEKRLWGVLEIVSMSPYSWQPYFLAWQKLVISTKFHAAWQGYIEIDISFNDDRCTFSRSWITSLSYESYTCITKSINCTKKG